MLMHLKRFNNVESCWKFQNNPLLIPVSRLSFLQQYSATNKGVCVCNEITWLWPWSALIHNQRLAVIGKIAARITVISTGFNFMWESEGHLQMTGRLVVSGDVTWNYQKCKISICHRESKGESRTRPWGWERRYCIIIIKNRELARNPSAPPLPI